MSETDDRIDTPLLQQPSIFAPGLFANKTYFITGGVTGIGLAIAAELRHLGANVIIGSRGEEKLRKGAETLEQIEGTGEVMWKIGRASCRERVERGAGARADDQKKRGSTGEE